MAVLDEDFGTDLTLAEGNGGVRSSPVSVPERAPRDWRSQCERERARADAAEAHAEELRWAEVASRTDAGAWKSRFKACRGRLSEAVEETKEARRAAREGEVEGPARQAPGGRGDAVEALDEAPPMTGSSAGRCAMKSLPVPAGPRSEARQLSMPLDALTLRGLKAKALQTHRATLRKDRDELQLFRRPRRSIHLDQISPQNLNWQGWVGSVRTSPPNAA